MQLTSQKTATLKVAVFIKMIPIVRIWKNKLPLLIVPIIGNFD
jgi:hypothetical protein